MKTFAASLLALGIFAGSASAQMCAPGYGQHRPTSARATMPTEQPQAPTAAPQVPAEPAPAPAPAPGVPQQ